MTPSTSMRPEETEAALSRFLRYLPSEYGNRYSDGAASALRRALCFSLVLHDESLLGLIYPDVSPDEPSVDWSLRKAQGAIEGAEYTEVARGSPCGHIFTANESQYHCKTCAADDTCVLCARCFAASDHDGHSVYVSVSPGNSGCCDCADDEAWVIPVHCSIHCREGPSKATSSGKSAVPAALPDDIQDAVRRTIGKALDFVCDVISCSPEQLRLPKTKESILADEYSSRLDPQIYDGPENMENQMEYTLLLWNDEKHTVHQVRDQVARACRQKKSFGLARAEEVDAVGRSVLMKSNDVDKLLGMARVLEQIKVSVTIRSSRDTFREQMCATIVDWLSDISGCSIGSDDRILRATICAQLFSSWRAGVVRPTELIGREGVYDHEVEDRAWAKHQKRLQQILALTELRMGRAPVDENSDSESDGEPDEDDEAAMGAVEDDTEAQAIEETETMLARNLNLDQLRRNRVVVTDMDIMDVEDEEGNVMVFAGEGPMDVDMNEDTEDNANEVSEATIAGYPPPRPPPTRSMQSLDVSRQGSLTDSQGGVGSQESDDAETVIGHPTSNLLSVPKTPRANRMRGKNKPPKYWLAKPNGWVETSKLAPTENLEERLRIDYLILYDLRLWKNLRDSLRHLYISTVVTVPEYKRLLGIRFAGLYTLLAQLYLIADREPDHSIINVSVQLLTTPSITAEVVERANFLTNLMAILYTFLTTRQVGYPRNILPNAALAVDAGAVTNRRMFHFFIDAKYIFQAASVQEKLRSEPQYLQQFVDLVKLHQGICPNVRAVGEHVEYETDVWFNASLIIKEINRLSRFVIDAFLSTDLSDAVAVQQVISYIRELSCVATISSLGLDSSRFSASEIKKPLEFCNVSADGEAPCVIPNVKVLDAFMSFHHPLHYITSWMLQAGKTLSREQIQANLFTETLDISLLRAQYPSVEMGSGPFAPHVKPHDWISALFDAPLRVLVWLSQMRAGLWVRNGMTLRHQAHAYRSPSGRDVTYQRDIFMLQAAMVLCDYGTDIVVGEKFFIQMVHRFDLQNWLHGNYKLGDGYEDSQHVDVIEDFFHLLVILLTERGDIMPEFDHGKPSKPAIQRDITHALCLRSLSYSDLTNRLTERITDSDIYDDVLKEMTTYKAPEGLNDSGIFELRPEYKSMIDPYYAFYSRNQREEADNVYRQYEAKNKGIDKADVVPEPGLPPISSGLFAELPSFTRTKSFAKLIFTTLGFMVAGHSQTAVHKARLESILQIVLHLLILTISEDPANDSGKASFIEHLFTDAGTTTIFGRLQDILKTEEYAACHPRVRLVIKRAQEKRPALFARHNLFEADMRFVSTPTSTAEKERKRKQALERQAKVMAKFKAQQNEFMSNQGLDWNLDDFSDDEAKDTMEGITKEMPETENIREYPADACILCQEEANDERLYGCFAMVQGSSIQRQTPLNDDDYVQEVIDTPASLDRSAESIRPFGKSAKNKEVVQRTAMDGTVVVQQQQVLSDGFKDFKYLLRDHVMTSCGHMMHFSCFETYVQATARRHSHQISREHPERLDRKEFLCPLCKALGNTFLPVIWKARKESYPGILGSAAQSFADWLVGDVKELESRLRPPRPYQVEPTPVVITRDRRTAFAKDYIETHFNPKLGAQVKHEGSQSPSAGRDRLRAARALAGILDVGQLVREFGLGGSPTTPTGTPGADLTRAYQVLQTSLEINCDPRRLSSTYPTHSLPYGQILQTIASSIAAVEIQQRGNASQHSLLTAVSEQALTNLRIVCETAQSLFAVEQVRDPKTANLAQRQESHGLSTLFGLDDADRFVMEPTMLRHNVFWSLTACSFLPGADWQRHGHNLIQFALIIEMAKAAIVHQLRRKDGRDVERGLTVPDEPEDPLFTSLFNTIAQLQSQEHSEALNGKMSSLPPVTSHFSRILKRIIMRQALIFLRKALILAHVRSGVDFSTASASIDSEAPELDRLCTLLRIPSLPSLISLFVGNSPAGSYLQAVTKRHIAIDHMDTFETTIRHIDHPAIFELVGLPKTFDTLTQEVTKRKCPTTGQQLTDPVVCLLCGEIFCSQGRCCMLDGIGGAGQHLKKCGNPIGLVVNIKKCMVLYLHERHGSWALAPYLDKHGEVDPTLRRHHQLFLNQKRYDKNLRDLWLSHGIPSLISRKLEGDINNGGWETM